jgi:hyperosmotically inducible protein
MNINVSSRQPALMQGRLFLDAMILAGLAAVLGLGPSDANAATQDAAGAAPMGSQKTERVVSDTWITTQVKSEILVSRLAKGFDVKVTTLDGIVTLEGSLKSSDVIDQVKAIAAEVKGVQSVDTSSLVVAAK